MSIEIRKTIVNIEDIRVEGGRAVPRPFKMVTVGAVILNPWANKGFVQDLQPIIRNGAAMLAHVLVDEALKHLSKDEIETFGKAAVVGTAGEVEHAAALIHSLYFGNVCRDAVGGTSYMPFSQKRGAPGCSLDVPMKNKRKEDEGSRAHFVATEIIVPDSPAADELIVVLGIASGGRPHHRIGDRYIDMKEMAKA